VAQEDIISARKRTTAAANERFMEAP